MTAVGWTNRTLLTAVVETLAKAARSLWVAARASATRADFLLVSIPVYRTRAATGPTTATKPMKTARRRIPKPRLQIWATNPIIAGPNSIPA